MESVPDTFRGMGNLEVLTLGGADCCRSIGGGGIFSESSISSVYLASLVSEMGSLGILLASLTVSLSPRMHEQVAEGTDADAEVYMQGREQGQATQRSEGRSAEE